MITCIGTACSACSKKPSIRPNHRRKPSRRPVWSRSIGTSRGRPRELEYRQAELRLQQLQNQINIDVRNAQFNMQQDRARVEAARQARDLAQHSLDIEQQKFKLGASTSFDVLTAQSNLGVAESTLVTALSQYEKSRVDLDRATGTSLTHLGIEIEDAERGRVQNLPHVEGATPRPEVSPVMPPAQSQQQPN